MGVPRIVTGILARALTVPLLTACGGSGVSIADPPVSPTSTSSPTGTPQRETPEHFIRRWAAEDTRIQRTGDTATFREMSDGCKGCLELADLVDQIYGAGGFIHTRGWQVRDISAM